MTWEQLSCSPFPASTCDRRNLHWVRSVLRLICIAVLIPVTAPAQDPPAPEITARGDEAPKNAEQPSEVPNDPARVLRQRLEGISVQLPEAQLEEAAHTALKTLLAQAQKQLELYEQLRQENADLRQRAAQLAEQVERLRSAPVLDAISRIDSMDVAALEEAVASAGVQLTSAEQTLTKNQQTEEQSAAQKQTLQGQVAGTEQELSEAAEQLLALPAEADDLPAKAERAEAEALRLKAEAEHDLARTRLAYLDAELSLKLPSLRVEYQRQLVQLHRERLQELKLRLEELRKEMSRQELERAQQSADQLAGIEDPEIKALGELRIELARDSDQIAQRDLPLWNSVLDRRRNTLQQLKESSHKIRQRVKQFGTHTTFGRELLHFSTELPSMAELQAEMQEIDRLTADWMLRRLDYADYEQQIELVTVRTRDTATQAETEILEAIDDVLQDLEHNNTTLFNTLADVNGEDRATIAFIDEWNAYVSERALWLRSHEPLTWTQVMDTLPSARRHGRHILESLVSAVRSTGVSLWLIVLPAGLAILILLAVQSRAKDGLLQHGAEARQRTCLTMRPTVLALLLSVGLAAEWPLILMLLGSILQIQSGGPSTALGQSLIQLGGIGLWLNFFRQVFRPGGLASDHLVWNPKICTTLRRWLHLVLAVVALPMFLFLLARHIPDSTDTPGRLTFLLVMICSEALLIQLLFPVNSPFIQTITGTSGFLFSTRYLWIGGILLIPVFLGVCCATGFYHTSLVLWDRLGWSVVTATLVVLGWSLIMRWLTISHRAMRLTLARERAQQRDQTDESTESSLLTPGTTDAKDLIVFGTKAQRLIRNAAILIAIGCAWGIWADTFPALQVLHSQKVWDVSEEITVMTTNDAGDEVTESRTVTHDVTVGSLLLVLFVAIATFTGVHELPGLTEMILLRQKQFDAGLRYTITTVIRYLLLFAGIAISCRLLGLRWSQVQWLVAGLSVGLGFGLQEVFANFVSGIIILIERPIRIGDVVTIDDVSGVVTRIQIRATSITDWDRREYIVPNRELVTGKLLNWTLSDSTNRVLIPVGISYGGDPDKARDIMLRIAGEHPNVMDDPSPVATFENFGDSSLNLVLRAYLPDMENRLGTITELHTAIHKAFSEEGIDIPFPQREVRMLP